MMHAAPSTGAPMLDPARAAAAAPTADRLAELQAVGGNDAAFAG